MIEGQEDVTWDDWQALAGACEAARDRDAVSLRPLPVGVRAPRARLARRLGDASTRSSAVTSKVRLGTLVSPATFRHPAELAKVVVTADHVSGGRVELGLGTGWNEAEHEAYGFPFPPMGERMKNIEEQLQLIARQWGDGPAQPKPVQQPAAQPDRRRSRRPAQHPHGRPLCGRVQHRQQDRRRVRRDPRAARRRLCSGGPRPDPALADGHLAGGEDRAELLDRAARLAEWQAQDTAPEAFLRASRTPPSPARWTRTWSDCASWPPPASSA